MTTRRAYNLSLLGGAILLLAAVAVCVVIYARGRQRETALFEISSIDIVSGETGPAALLVSGTHFPRQMEAMLLPSPALEDGDPRRLLPRIPMFQVDTDGDLLVASVRGMRILTVAVGAEVQPQILGSVELAGKESRSLTITSMAMTGKRVVACLNNNGGVFLVDTADPSAPRKIDHLSVDTDITDMLAVGGAIFAADSMRGLYRVLVDGDRLSFESVPGPRQSWRLASDGNHLISASLQGELALYELRGDGEPALLGVTQVPKEVRGVALNGNLLHLCYSDGIVQEYLLGSWPRLVPRAEVLLPGRPLRLVSDRESGLLFCALVGVGVAVIDFGQAGYPVSVNWLTTNTAISDISLAAGRLFYTNNSGLKIRNIDRLQALRQLSMDFPIDQRRKKVRLLSWHGAALAYDDEALVPLSSEADRENLEQVPRGELLAVPGSAAVRLYARQKEGLVVVKKIPIPSFETDRHDRPYATMINAALLQDGHLYALTEKKLHVFACDPSGKVENLGFLDGFKGAEALVSVAPATLLVAERLAGLSLVSVRDATAPRVVDRLPVPAFLENSGGGAYDVVIDGNRAFVARGVFGIAVVEIDKGEKLRMVQLIDTPGSVRKLTISGRLLFANDRGRGIQVFDLGGESIRHLGTIEAASQFEDIIVANERLYFNSATGAVSQIGLPRRLGAVRFDSQEGHITLPEGLSVGRYGLVLYDGDRIAKAEFTLK